MSGMFPSFSTSFVTKDGAFVQSMMISQAQNLSLQGSSTPEEDLVKAADLKDQGTEKFNAGDYKGAAKDYKRAASLAYTDPLHGDHADIFVKCWLNAGLCYIKEKSWHEVLHCCNTILEYHKDSKTNIKVLYRRGLAQMHLDNLDEAKADLMGAYKIDSKNKDVCKAITELKAKIAAAKKKEKTQFGGAFGKISMYDEKSVNYVLVPSARGDELINFPDTILAAVAEYLTKTERALTAVAMTASATTWSKLNWKIEPSVASKIMVAAKPLDEIKVSYYGGKWRQERARLKSYDWDFVDFEDICKLLARKLTDGDIGGLLVCVDAVNTIKTLKLRGCISITGHGLEPLRGSLVLKQLDLSLVSSEGSWNESPRIYPAPSISAEAVIPILDSIVDGERSNLEQLQLPKKWRSVHSHLISTFLSKYNRVLDNRELTCCLKHHYKDPPCGAICRGSDEYPWFHETGEDIGIQTRTCYECNKHFCEDHLEDMIPFICGICEKASCMDCNKTTFCESCHKVTCYKCTRIDWCGVCEEALCGQCSRIYWCSSCEEKVCTDCSPFLLCDYESCQKDGNCTMCSENEDGVDWGVRHCESCESNYCVDHLILDISSKEGEGAPCEECLERALAEMLRLNKLIQKKIHEKENMLGFEGRFETDLESSSISKLLAEQEKMKRRWDHLYNKMTEDQKKESWIGHLLIESRA